MEGERVNLILWARSSGYRGNLAYGHLPLDVKGVGGADLVCLSKANDRDYVRKVKELGGGEAHSKDEPVVHKKDDGSILGFDTFTKKKAKKSATKF